MKKIKILFLSLFVLAACSKDDDDNGTAKSSAKAITTFVFTAAENDALSADVKAAIDEDKKTIAAEFPTGTDVTVLKPSITLSEDAKVSPGNKESKDFSEAVSYTVTAEDGTEAKYSVTATVGKSDAKAILEFIFAAEYNESLSADVKATIDEDEKTIAAEVPFGTNVKALTPSITISEKAKVSPENNAAKDFSEAVTYTVTAEDGSTTKYIITITVEKSDAKQITSFMFLAEDNEALSEDVEASIDEDKKTITAEMPIGTDVTVLKPIIEVSVGATVSPGSKVERDFSDSVLYTVITKNGSKAEYNVTVTVKQSTAEREMLITLYNANPDNTLTWDLEDGDISNWEGVTIENGSVVELDLQGNSLEIIPREIFDLKNLTKLDLAFNNLTTMPIEIEKLENLEELSLTGNRSITSIPSEIGNCINLSLLAFGETSITSIPKEIGNLVKLTKLFLYSSPLTSIPNEIGDLTNLKTLSLFDNSLTTIPNEIGDLINLELLFLRGNPITSIPSEIGNLTNLTTLDISNTQITVIPKTVCDLNIPNFTRDATAECEQ